MPPRLKVLFVTPYLPSPPHFGGQQRLHSLIYGLSRSHETSVLSLVEAGGDHAASLRATRAYCRRVVAVPNHRYAAKGASKRILQLRSLFSPRSHEWLVHHDRRLESALDEMLSTEHYDIVQFSFAQMAACRSWRAEVPGTRPAFCLDEHNIEYDVIRRTAGMGSGRLRRGYSALDWRKLRIEERQAWARFDGCTLTSARDQHLLLADAPWARTAVVPNGVDLDYFQPRDEPRAPANLLFFGAIDYFPNTDGLLFFLEQVFPLLKAKYPALRLTIVGRKPPDVILARRAEDVEIAGLVDDVRPYLARATAVIAPLRIGGGTRLKILEAMAMGKAVVSTSIGVEGLDVVPGRDVLVADDPRDFAASVGRLLEEPTLAESIGEAAQRLVTARYGWRASLDRLSAFYAELLETRRAA